ncbi:hypothetical protein BV898_12038 [Hypsibius exemplaris]|uniref:Uncharacterized protein n=1 Tax=Hypsibius exemplaris TaxID=2072580 RepID=A0A1W0WEW3_HYPEX|nr:hypothetical protein BV898_12038 [Hypsibius exemplaris]
MKSKGSLPLAIFAGLLLVCVHSVVADQIVLMGAPSDGADFTPINTKDRVFFNNQKNRVSKYDNKFDRGFTQVGVNTGDLTSFNSDSAAPFFIVANVDPAEASDKVEDGSSGLQERRLGFRSGRRGRLGRFRRFFGRGRRFGCFGRRRFNRFCNDLFIDEFDPLDLDFDDSVASSSKNDIGQIGINNGGITEYNYDPDVHADIGQIGINNGRITEYNYKRYLRDIGTILVNGQRGHIKEYNYDGDIDQIGINNGHIKEYNYRRRA